MIEHELTGGGGSGGSPVTLPAMGVSADPVNKVETIEGAFSITANQIDLVCSPPPPPAVPGPTVIGILALSETMMDGEVNIGADKGVRITAGPPSMPPAGPLSASGVEVMVGEIQNITLQRGLIPDVDQMIQMTPEGITIDGGAMPITIKSLTQITLSVAEGMSTITLSPEGVSIQGVPMVQIQGGPLVMIN